jgi:hypothetical protein
MMIGRRSALLGTATLLCAGAGSRALPVPPGNRLSFQVIRKGGVIGSHVIEFVPDASKLTVRIAVDIAVGIGPIVLFRYTHRSEEHWVDHAFTAMETTTNDNGTHDFVAMHKTEDGYAVHCSRFGDYVAPANVLPGSNWDERMLSVPVINTQHGKLLRPHVTMLSEESVPDASGGTIEARHFAVRGDANIDTWYDSTPSWAALRFTSHEGSEITYKRIQA